jgi:hypothetical protein
VWRWKIVKELLLLVEDGEYYGELELSFGVRPTSARHRLLHMHDANDLATARKMSSALMLTYTLFLSVDN